MTSHSLLSEPYLPNNLLSATGTGGNKPAQISVLYVDDEPEFLALCKIFLERSGNFVVDTAISPTIALKMIRSSDYDVIVSDYQMPEMNGIEFFAEVAKTHGHLPFVLFTGRDRTEVTSPLSDVLVDFYLQKSVHARDMFVALALVIRKAAEKKQVMK
jgi:DNA-binding NarL/FixJ family response regulator